MSDVEFKGPFFDNAAWNAGMDDLQHDIAFDIADEGVHHLREMMIQTYKVPTGAYESTVHTEREARGAKIDGEGKVYAWWLEGTGSRNYPRTRFPGYWLFMKETMRLMELAQEFAEVAKRKFVERMN